MSLRKSDPLLMAHLEGCMESVDETIGPCPSPQEFAETGMVPDIKAMEMANLLVAADEGLISEEDAEHLPLPYDPSQVHMPAHYSRFPIEPVRFIGENNLGFLPGNVIKYVLRWDAKDGVQDLYKAKRYLEMMIAFVEGDKEWWRQRKPEATQGDKPSP